MKRTVYFLAAALALLPARVSAQRYAVTTVSANIMRSEPDFESSMETQCLMGTLVEILEEDGIWRKISCPEPYEAWVNELTLSELSPEEAGAWLAEEKYIFTPLYGHVLDAPSRDAGFISDLVAGDIMRITRKNGRPLRHGRFLGVTLPSGKRGWVPKKELAPFKEWAVSRQATAGNVISTAKLLLGTPYLWGGESPKGLDCSGLVRYCFFLNGVLLPRNTSQQVKLGEEIPVLDKDGNIDLSALIPGDLVFFFNEKTGRVNHVTIYMGDGNIIQSSQLVRINTITDPSSPDYYSRRPLCARRILSHIGEPGICPLTSSPSYFPQK